MSELEFLSPDRARSGAVWRSPLERALRDAPAGIEDLSRSGKIEVRGDVDGLDVDTEVVRITPERALVLCPPERTAEVRARLRGRFRTVVDMSGSLAGLRVRGEALMRRLTDLDLGALPAAGPVARVPAIVLRDADGWFRLFFPQEYGHYLAQVVIDTTEGLR